MPIELQPRSLYAAFDRFPSAKGAATHIAHFVDVLFDHTDGGLLYVLGGDDLPVYQREGGVEILRYERDHPNQLERAIGFGRRLEELLDDVGESLEICHFRDPWSGVPIFRSAKKRYRTVYEVNALPSIELPSRFPHISPSALTKIRAAEELCWRSADVVVTPSETIAANLRRLGVDSGKIVVIPNGAEIPGDDETIMPATPITDAGEDEGPSTPGDVPGRYLIYFGAMQRWQGVDVLLRAFARLADIDDLYLVVCSSTHRRTTKGYRKLAANLGVDDRIIWRHGLGKPELGAWISGAALSLAPLTECARNLEQGCSPLKVLESMVRGIPVVASDIPAVREIITDGVDGRLVRPDRPAELARAIRVLLEYPERIREMGENARAKIENNFTWQHAAEKLRTVYETVGASSRPIV